MRGLAGDPPPRAQKSDSDSPDPVRALDELMERHPIAGRQIPAAHLKTLQDEIATYADLEKGDGPRSVLQSRTYSIGSDGDQILYDLAIALSVNKVDLVRAS